METQKIKFKDLDGWLKFIVVMGYILVGLWVLIFISGFVAGYLGL